MVFIYIKDKLGDKIWMLFFNLYRFFMIYGFMYISILDDLYMYSCILYFFLRSG